jgi:hypothetical protein
MKSFLVAVCLPGVMGFLTTGCEMKREAIGADDEIVVLAASEDRDDLRPVLEKIFNDTIYTPQPEPVYKLKFVDPAGFPDLRRQTNLVIGSIGTDPLNPGTRLVQELLGKEQFRTTIEGENQIIFTRDQFALHQLFMILSARNRESLLSALTGKADWIRSQFDRQFEQRQGKFLFERSRRKKLERRFAEKYGWQIKIPWGWVVIRDSSEARFVWLGREMPYQWISIHWEEGIVAQDSLEAVQFAWEFPGRYYGNIRYHPYRFQARLVDFNRWAAWRYRGLWESTEEAQGGPFLSYLFYDGVSDRTYYLNLLIHYPGNDKSLYLRQLDLIAHSFTVPE